MKIRFAYLVISLLLVLVGMELFYNVFPISFERSAPLMGTTVRIKINGSGSPSLTKQAIFETQRLDRILSKFNPSSEVSRLNCGEKFPLSPDIRKVLVLAEKVKRLSSGAFDVCYRGKIDLGAVGKGYAVESARQLLLKQGVKSAIIDMHSSIAVIGDGWRISVRDPQDSQKVLGVVALNNGEALSTSAQYEQPRHIVDPRTGKPANKCLSVTVIARDAGLADALSTAVFVLGPKEGMGLIRAFGVRGLIIDKGGKIYDNFGFKLW